MIRWSRRVGCCCWPAEAFPMSRDLQGARATMQKSVTLLQRAAAVTAGCGSCSSPGWAMLAGIFAFGVVQTPLVFFAWRVHMSLSLWVYFDATALPFAPWRGSVLCVLSHPSLPSRPAPPGYYQWLRAFRGQVASPCHWGRFTLTGKIDSSSAA